MRTLTHSCCSSHLDSSTPCFLCQVPFGCWICQRAVPLVIHTSSSVCVRRWLVAGSVILHPQRVMCKLPALILRALDLVFIVCRFLNSPHRISQSRCSCCRTFFYCMPLAKLLLHFYTLKRKFCCFYNLPGGTRSKWAVTFQWDCT